MPLDADAIRFAQEEMTARLGYAGPKDGVLNAAMAAALNGHAAIRASWPLARKVTGYVQTVVGLAGNDVDGLWGDQTQLAYDAYRYRIVHGASPPAWRPEDRAQTNPNNWPRQGSTDADLIAFYGEVGTQQTRITLPYPHRIAWNLSRTVNSFPCHRRVHDSLHRVLTKVLRIYGLPEIQRLRLDVWGGCLNVRPMRGGNRMSTHSWGIALDYDPEHNQLQWGRDRASLARPEYEPWWRCWEEEGWVSLGRERNFDWMHVQAARL